MKNIFQNATNETLICILLNDLHNVTERGYTKPVRKEIDKVISELKRRGVISADDNSILDEMLR